VALVRYGVAAGRRLKHQQVSTRVPSGCQISPARRDPRRPEPKRAFRGRHNTGSDHRAVFIGVAGKQMGMAASRIGLPLIPNAASGHLS
jgi:hypothetical protein